MNFLQGCFRSHFSQFPWPRTSGDPWRISEEWQDGGWQGDQKRLEHDEAKALVRVWELALCLQNETRDNLDQVETELRVLVGERAYCSGNLPGPIPRWRVPRR